MTEPQDELPPKRVVGLEWFSIALPHTFKIVRATSRRDLGLDADAVEVSRERNLNLRLSAYGDGYGDSFDEDGTEPGTENKGITIVLDSNQGEVAAFRRTQYQGVMEGERRRATVSGEIDSVSLRLSEKPCAKVTEWISNLPHRNWPHSTQRGRAWARDHIQLQLDFPTLGKIVIGEVPETYVTEGVEVPRPGFIEYYPGREGLPDERLRTTVRRAFEFLLGAGLGVLGYTEQDAEGNPVSVFFGSAYVAGGTDYPPYPPALLHPHCLDGLSTEHVTPLLRKYIEKEPSWHLNSAVWRYLHSRNSPLEMAAGYVGAAFEVIRRGFFEMPEHEGASRLLPSERWKRLAAALADSVSGLMREADWLGHADELASVTSRLVELNKVSGRKLNHKFLQTLGLDFGESENLALAARNSDAHAALFSPSKAFEKLRAYRALQTLFARALLAMLDAKTQYFDYSSVGHPLRPLRERQGAPTPP